MKNIIKLLIVVVSAVFACSCGSKNDGPQVGTRIVAEWHLVSVTGIDSVPEVYIDFASGGSFELFQKIGEGRFRKYLGTYTVSGKKLSGKYADGEDWGSEYEVSFDGEDMLLTALNGSGEVCGYEKKALPASDKAEADLVTRSDMSEPRFL